MMVGNRLDNETSDTELNATHSTATNNQNDFAETAEDNTSSRIVHVLNTVLGAAVLEHQATVRLAQQRQLFIKQGLHTIRQAQAKQLLCHSTNNNLEENYNHPEIHRLLSTSKQRRTKRTIRSAGDDRPDTKAAGKRHKTESYEQSRAASTTEANDGASGAADDPRVPPIRHCHAPSDSPSRRDFNNIDGKEMGENYCSKDNCGVDQNCNDQEIQQNSCNLNSFNEILNHLQSSSTIHSISQPTSRLNNDNVNTILGRDINSQHSSHATSCTDNCATASSKVLSPYRENDRGGGAASSSAFKSASNSKPTALRGSQGGDGATGSTLKPLTLKKTVQCTLSQSRQDRCLKDRRVVVGNHYKAITVADVPLHVNCSRSKYTFSHHGYKYIWKAFVREAEQGALDCIKAVTFVLDKSYAPHHVQTVRSPPFEIERSGWGEFSLKLTLALHNSVLNRPITLRHKVALGQDLDALAHSGYWRTGKEAVYSFRLFEPATQPTSPLLPQRRPADLSHELQQLGAVITDRCQENVTVEHSIDLGSLMRPPETVADRGPRTTAREPLNVDPVPPFNSEGVWQNGNVDVECGSANWSSNNIHGESKLVPSSIEGVLDSLGHLADQPVNAMMNDSFNTSDINIDDTPLQNMTIPNFATEEITDFFEKLESESNENTMCDTFKEVMDRNSCGSAGVLINSASPRGAGTDKALEGSSGLLSGMDGGSLSEILNGLSEEPLNHAAANCQPKENNSVSLQNSSVSSLAAPESCADTSKSATISFDGALVQNNLFDDSSPVISASGFEGTINGNQNTVKETSVNKSVAPGSCDALKTASEDLKKGLKRKIEEDEPNCSRLKPNIESLPQITSLRCSPSSAAASPFKAIAPLSGVTAGNLEASKPPCPDATSITAAPAVAAATAGGSGALTAKPNIRQVTIRPNSKLMTLPPGSSVAKFIGNGSGAPAKPNTVPRVVLEKMKLDAKGTGQALTRLVSAVKGPVSARNGSVSAAGKPLITLPSAKQEDLNNSSDEVQIVAQLPTPASSTASLPRLPIKIPLQNLPPSLISSIQSKMSATNINNNSTLHFTSNGGATPFRINPAASDMSKRQMVNLGQLQDPKIQQMLANLTTKMKASPGSSVNLSGLPLTTPQVLKIAGNSLVIVSSGGPSTSNAVTFTSSFTTVVSSSMSATSTVRSLKTHIHSTVVPSKSSVVASGSIVISAPSVVARTVASNSITTVTTGLAASLSSSRVAVSTMSGTGNGAGGATIRVLPSNVRSSACITSTGIITMSGLPNFPLGTKIKLEPSAAGALFQNRKLTQPELIRLDQSSSKIVIKTETGSASQSQNVQLKNVGKPTFSGSSLIDGNSLLGGPKLNTAVTKSDPSKDQNFASTKLANGSFQFVNASRSTSSLNLLTSKVKDVLPTTLLNGKHVVEAKKEVNCGSVIGSSLPFDVSNIKQEKVEDWGSAISDGVQNNVMQPKTSAPSVVVQTPRSTFSSFPISSLPTSTVKTSTVGHLKMSSNLNVGGGVSRTATGNLVISGGSKPIILTQDAIAALMQQGVKISMPSNKLGAHLGQKSPQVTLMGTAGKEAQGMPTTLAKSGLVGARSVIQPLKVVQSSDGKVPANAMGAPAPAQPIRMTPLVLNKNNTGKGVPIANVIPNLNNNSTSVVYNGQTYYSIGTLNKGTSTVKLNNVVGDANSAGKMKGTRYISNLSDLPSVLTALTTPLNRASTIMLPTGQQTKLGPKILPRQHTIVDHKPMMSHMKLFDRKLTTGQLVSQGRLPTAFQCAPPAVANVDDDVEEISVDTAGLSKYRKNKIEEKQALRLMKNLPFLEASCRAERSSPSEHLRLWVRALPLVLPDSEASIALHYLKPRHGNCKPIKPEPYDFPDKRRHSKESRGPATGVGLARKSTGVVGLTNASLDAKDCSVDGDTVKSEPAGAASEATSGSTVAKVVDVLQTRLIIRRPKVTREQYLQWPVGKRRAHEFSRARAVVRYMRSCCKECSDDNTNWTIRAVVAWTRQHGYTPSPPRRFLRTDAFPSEWCLQHEHHKRLLHAEPQLGGLVGALGTLAAQSTALLDVGDAVTVKQEPEEKVAEEEPLPDENLIWSWSKVFAESPPQKDVKAESEAATNGSTSPSLPKTDPPTIKSEFPLASSIINTKPKSLSNLNRNSKPGSSSLSSTSNAQSASCSPKPLSLEGGCSWVRDVAGGLLHRLSAQEQLLPEERSVALGGRLVTAPPLFADTSSLVLFKAMSLFLEDLTRSSLSVAWGQQQRHRRRKPGQKKRPQQATPRPPSGAAADSRHRRPPPPAGREDEGPRRFKRQRGNQRSTGLGRRDDWDRLASNKDMFPPRKFAKVGRPSKEELRLRALQCSAPNASKNEPRQMYPSNRGTVGSIQPGRGRGKAVNNVRKGFPNSGRFPKKHEETFNGHEAPRISQKPVNRFGRKNNSNSADHNSRKSNLKSTATERNSSSTKPYNLSERNSKIPRSNEVRARQSVSSRAADPIGTVPKFRPPGTARDEGSPRSRAGKRDPVKPLPEALKSSAPTNCGPVRELHPRHVLFALERSRPQFQIIASKIRGTAIVAAANNSSSSARPAKTNLRTVAAPPVYIKQEPL